MKKIKYLIVAVTSLFIFNLNVYAASADLSVSQNSISSGDTFTISVKMNDAAAWNIHVETTGPVSDCTINEADATSDGENTTKTFEKTCTATGEGTIKIVLSGDITSAVDLVAVDLDSSKEITVSKKATEDDDSNTTTNTTNTTTNTTINTTTNTTINTTTNTTNTTVNNTSETPTNPNTGIALPIIIIILFVAIGAVLVKKKDIFKKF